MKKKKTHAKKKTARAVSVAKKSNTKSNTLGIEPLGDRVVLKPFSVEETAAKTVSGIILPESDKQQFPEQGKIVAIGEGTYRDGVLVPMRVRVGDTVVFSKYGFDEIKINGTEYYILKEDAILAIMSH